MLGENGAGEYLGELVAASGVLAMILPFVVASLVRLIQGSGTVAMITGQAVFFSL